MADMTVETATITGNVGISNAIALLRERRDKLTINAVTERIAINAVIAQLDEASSALFFLARRAGERERLPQPLT